MINRHDERVLGLRLWALAPLAVALWVAASLAMGCDNPDTEAAFDDFVDRTADMIPEAGELGPGEGELATGRYFMAVSTVVAPPQLLFLEVMVEVSEDGTSADFELQPVKTDADGRGNPRDDPRVPIGDPVIITDVALEDGSFVFETGEITVHGDANPITTGAAIVAELTFTGVVFDEETFCGRVDGDVKEPVSINVDGSSFAAVRFDGDFTEITEPLFRCPEGAQPDPDPGPDAGAPDAGSD